MPSEVVGTGALWVGLVIATITALAQRPPAATLRAAAMPAAITLLVQAAHFGEEYATEFYRLFPERLGLASWSAQFFVIFNLIWLSLWLGAIAAAYVGRARLYSAIVLWFLAIAAIGNGIAHPLFAISARGYFPGLITAPLLGIAGLFLARSLLSPRLRSPVR
ncbi:MAG: HXXEE domain-containing protein [Alphaproteobacteria bacterium]|nr:HXXEE domain-containing protein [Alphaproteobacteria bacterium]